MNRQKLIEGDLLQSAGITVRKVITLQDAAGEGAIGTVDVFTVSGACKVRISAYCGVTLTGATATISLGVANAVDSLIAVTTGTLLEAGEFWIDNAPAIVEPALAVQNVALDIQLNVLVAAVTAGEITFLCEYEPITENAKVEAA